MRKRDERSYPTDADLGALLAQYRTAVELARDPSAQSFALVEQSLRGFLFQGGTIDNVRLCLDSALIAHPTHPMAEFWRFAYPALGHRGQWTLDEWSRVANLCREKLSSYLVAVGAEPTSISAMTRLRIVDARSREADAPPSDFASKRRLLGAAVRLLREQAQLSAEAVAVAAGAGVTSAWVSRFEGGTLPKPDPARFHAVLRAVGTTVGTMGRVVDAGWRFGQGWARLALGDGAVSDSDDWIDLLTRSEGRSMADAALLLSARLGLASVSRE